jgi:hypothetical protein
MSDEADKQQEREDLDVQEEDDADDVKGGSLTGRFGADKGPEWSRISGADKGPQTSRWT